MTTDKNVESRPEGAGTALDVVAPTVTAPNSVAPTAVAPTAVAIVPALPAVRQAAKRRWLKPSLLVLALLLATGGGLYWWLRPQTGLPPGIAAGNGRLEADEIDIDTKYPGRIAQLFADEGDLTSAGQVLARMDTRDFAASLKKSQALIVQADQTIDAARATLEQQKSQVLFAQQEIARSQALVGKGFATREELDTRTQALVSATAGQRAAENVIGEMLAARDAATHDAELYQVEIDDSSLLSPRDGRIEYRVANVGEVLPAGGKVFTILDTSYVYMDVYLSALTAGRVKLGSDARIVVDAYPAHPLPAKVVFLAKQAQFTPKTVETQDERDVLMFRVRVRIDADQLAGHADAVRSGLPGVAYVLTDQKAAWPAALKGDAAP